MVSEYLSEEFKEILTQHLSGMKNSRTRTEYWGCINMVCNALKKDFLLIDEADAASYFSSLRTKISDKKLSRKTFNTRLSCCRTVASNVENNYPEYRFKNPFTSISFPEVKNEITDGSIPTMKELDAVMSAAKASSLMDYLIFALATRVCISSTAIVKLTKECVRKENGATYLVVLPSGETKNNHDVNSRLLKLPSDVAEILDKYIATLDKTDDEGHLFYNEKNRPLRLRNLDSRITKVVAQSGIGKSFTMRDFRNRGILDMVAAGGDDKVEEVRDYLGVQPARMFDYVKSVKLVTGCPPDLVNYRLVCPET